MLHKSLLFAFVQVQPISKKELNVVLGENRVIFKTSHLI